MAPPKASSDSEQSSDNIGESHLQKLTVMMLSFYEQHKETLSFHNSVTNASSPYEVADKVWNILDIDEVCANENVLLSHYKRDRCCIKS